MKPSVWNCLTGAHKRWLSIDKYESMCVLLCFYVCVIRMDFIVGNIYTNAIENTILKWKSLIFLQKNVAHESINHFECSGMLFSRCTVSFQCSLLRFLCIEKIKWNLFKLTYGAYLREQTSSLLLLTLFDNSQKRDLFASLPITSLNVSIL